MAYFKVALLIFGSIFCGFYNFFPQKALAQKFDHQRLLDGADSLAFYDIDTTGHWWAITKPFANRYKMYINDYESPASEDLTFPVFAAGGRQWSFFAVYNSSVHRVENNGDEIIEWILDATDFGEIAYSPNGEFAAYTYFQDGNEIVQLPNRQITVTNRFGQLFIDNSGTSFTILGKRMSHYVININGRESATYDSIIPIGYWHNRNFVYAAFNGNNWEIYCGNRRFGGTYSSIIDVKINPAGTILAVLVRLNTGRSMAIVFNDDYYEPIYGRTYDNVWNLALHPTDMLYGYVAMQHSRLFVVQNSTEYPARGEVGTPFYSYNGDELIFFGMGEFGPYINVNGKQTDIRIGLYAEDIIAKKPGSETIAYTTHVSLLVYDYVKNRYFVGFMCDRMGGAIYNRYTRRYEALGEINNRLYLLHCEL